MEEGPADQEWPENAAGYRECVALEQSVLCSICRDYFNTPLSLICGHSFCSQCIRSNLQFQERTSSKAHCPQCREATDSRQLHPNHQLREIVKHFLLARPLFIAAMSQPPSEEPAAQRSKRQKVMQKEAPLQRVLHEANGRRQKRSRGRESDDVIQLDSTSEQEEGSKPVMPRLRQRSVAVEYYPKDEVQENDDGETTDASAEVSSVSDSDTSESLIPSPSPSKRRRSSLDSDSRGKRQKPGSGKSLPDNWVACPVCSRNFPMAIFNDHLDKCLANGKAAENGDDHIEKSGKGNKRLQVPPKLLLSLEKDKSLRDRLKSYNLSTKGSRQELEQRYTKFRLEVQTAMDKNEAGVSYASLAKRVMGRENSEIQAGSKAPLLRAAPKKSSDLQGSEFDKLIKATKARDGAPSTRMDSTSNRRSCQGGETEEEEVCSQPTEKLEVGLQQSSKSVGFRRQSRV